MLGPTPIEPADFPMALKPTLGYELQLYVSTQLSVELGTLNIAAVNGGVYTPSAADNAALPTRRSRPSCRESAIGCTTGPAFRRPTQPAQKRCR